MVRKQKAGALLGKGATGCVFKPTLQCDDPKKGPFDTKSVGKVFQEGWQMDEEMYFMNMIKKFDPQGLYTNTMVDNCTVSRSNFMKDPDHTKCVFLKQTPAHQLVLKHTGKDLDNHLKTEGMDLTFLKGLLNVMNGLEKMQQNSLVHRDLKLPNLIYTEDKTMLMIDFGITISYEDVYDGEESEFALEAEYSVFPPEFLYYGTVTSKNMRGDPNFNTHPLMKERIWGGFANDKNYSLKEHAPKSILHEVDSAFRVMPPPAKDTKERSLIVVSKTDGICQLRAFEMELKKRVQEKLGGISPNKQRMDDIYFELFTQLCDKVDVYGFGMCILHVLSYKAANFLNKEAFKRLLRLAMNATNLNPYARSSISEMISEMREVITVMTYSAGAKATKKGGKAMVHPKTKLEKDINTQICSKKHTLNDLRAMAKILNIKFEGLTKEKLCRALYKDLTS